MLIDTTATVDVDSHPELEILKLVLLHSSLNL